MLAISYLLVDFGARRAGLQARKGSEAANVAYTAVHQQPILSVACALLSLATAEAGLEAALGDPDDAPAIRMLVGHCAFVADEARLMVSLVPQLVHVRVRAGRPR